MRMRALRVVTGVVALGVAGLSSASAATPRPGTVDTAFGSHGVVHLAPASTAPSRSTDPQAHVLAATGSRLWVGADQGHGSYALPLTLAGRSLTTFDHGRPVVPVSDENQVLGLRSVLPTVDGGALVVTQFTDPSTVQVDRVKANGARDTGYGTQGGSTYVTPSCGDCGFDVTGAALLADGRLRVMGTYTDGATAVRQALVVGLTPHGRLDTAVGPEGWHAVAGSPDATTQAAGVDTYGRLYFLVDDAGQPGLLRTTVDGVLDPTYHASGIVAITLPGGRALSQASHAAAPDDTLGTLVVSPSGEAYVGVDARTRSTPVRWQAVLFHVDAHGVLDQSFGPGADGFTTYALTGGSGSISALGTDGHGHFVLGLTYWDGTHFQHLILRTTGTGDPDGHFGHRAAVPSATYVAALARGPNHRLYATGWPTRGRTNAPAGRSLVTAYID